MAEPYESFVQLISAVELDLPQLLPFSCLMGREWDHLDALLTVTVTPVVLFAGGSVMVQATNLYTPKGDRARAHSTFRYYFARLMLLA